MAKYLDSAGVGRLWSKVKTYVDDKVSNNGGSREEKYSTNNSFYITRDKINRSIIISSPDFDNKVISKVICNLVDLKISSSSPVFIDATKVITFSAYIDRSSDSGNQGIFITYQSNFTGSVKFTFDVYVKDM